MRSYRLASAAVLSVALTACHSDPAAPSDPQMIVRPIHIDSVQVVTEAAPAAHVRGIVGDGCTDISGIIQLRTGASIEITILSTRPAEAICSQIAKVYDAVLPLAGSFPAGAYVVTVNGVEAQFALP